jgi:hypothetical protein
MSFVEWEVALFHCHPEQASAAKRREGSHPHPWPGVGQADEILRFAQDDKGEEDGFVPSHS